MINCPTVILAKRASEMLREGPRTLFKIFFIVFWTETKGVCKICQGGDPIFLIVLASCMARSLLGGFGSMLPREIFKWCNLVRFGVYFDKILT